MTQAKKPTIDESVTTYLRPLSGANKSASTITAYRTDLTQFARFPAETNCTIATPADVGRGDIAEHLSHLAEQGISGNTRARKLAAIREFFRFLENEGLVASNPTLGVATPKKERGGRTPSTSTASASSVPTTEPSHFSQGTWPSPHSMMGVPAR
jgi:site-specific recombinase XerD